MRRHSLPAPSFYAQYQYPSAATAAAAPTYAYQRWFEDDPPARGLPQPQREPSLLCIALRDLNVNNIIYFFLNRCAGVQKMGPFHLLPAFVSQKGLSSGGGASWGCIPPALRPPSSPQCPRRSPKCRSGPGPLPDLGSDVDILIFMIFF